MENKIWVSTDHMQLVSDFFNQEPVIRIARNLIHNTLFSAGLEVESKGRKSSEAFNQLLSKHWIPFAAEVLDNIFMFGFCPYYTKQVKVKTSTKDNNGKAVVPVIPPFGSYKVELRMSPDFERSLHLYPLTSYPSPQDQENTQGSFLTVPKYFPDIKGVLRSQLAPLVYSFQNSRLFMDYALHAEHLQTHPTLFTQSSKEKNRSEAVAMEMYADGDAYMSREEAQYAKNKQQMNDFHRQQNMAAVLNGKHRTQIPLDPLTGKPRTKKQKQVWEDNVFVLPDGQQMAPGVQVQSRGDLLEMERLRYDLICGVMGVPKGLVITDRGGAMSGSGVSDITYKIFMRTMEGLKFMICELLEEVYEKVYGDESCTITLPFLPITSMEEIIRLSDQGVVSRKDAGTYMLRSLGLPESILSLQPIEQQPSESLERPAKKQKRTVEEED